MEYKGMTIRQMKNENVIIIVNRTGETHVISHKGYLNDRQLQELADKQVNVRAEELEE